MQLGLPSNKSGLLTEDFQIDGCAVLCFIMLIGCDETFVSLILISLSSRNSQNSSLGATTVATIVDSKTICPGCYC